MTKVIITAAGKGTRLLPFTKEMPKEMMPIFSQTFTKNRVVLPLLQYIYEQLYSMNFRDYCFVVGREKRSIEDHFTPHEAYLKQLTFLSTIEKWIANAPRDQAFPVAFRLEKHLSPRPSDNPASGLTGRISTHYFFNYTDSISRYCRNETYI